MLPDAWVSKIFARMEGRYGSLFHDRWKGCDLDNVKGTWAEELAAFASRPEAIGHALSVLANAKFPPTLPEFIEACRHAPAMEAPRLRHVPTAEDEERARAAAAKAATALKPIRGDGIDAHWATHPRSHMQMKFIREAAARDRRFAPCLAEMVEKGICTEDGHLLKTYRDGQWFPVRRAA